jgi:hypothetical protein
MSPRTAGPPPPPPPPPSLPSPPSLNGRVCWGGAGSLERLASVAATSSDKDMAAQSEEELAQTKRVLLSPIKALPGELIFFQRVLQLLRGLATQYSVQLNVSTKAAPPLYTPPHQTSPGTPACDVGACLCFARHGTRLTHGVCGRAGGGFSLSSSKSGHPSRGRRWGYLRTRARNRLLAAAVAAADPWRSARTRGWWRALYAHLPGRAKSTPHVALALRLCQLTCAYARRRLTVYCRLCQTWIMGFDEDGDMYYKSSISGEVLWEQPPEVAAAQAAAQAQP